MIKINNWGRSKYEEYIKNKALCVFGGGRSLDSYLEIFGHTRKISLIVDNNPDIWGERTINGINVRITGVDGLVAFVNEKKIENVCLIIVSPFYAADIVKQLDDIEGLNGIVTFLLVLMKNIKEYYTEYDFTKGVPLIPKKIHYIWFGGKPLPTDYIKNIESWERYNPDYEIIRWDENNYNIDDCIYARQAYESNAWGYISNYARLDIVYKYGGIYLDTDVEVLSNFDCLLQDKVFFCMGSTDRINNGCGFGSVAKHPIVRDMLKKYKKSEYILADGRKSNQSGHSFLHPVLKDWGFEIRDKYQKIDNAVVYPKEVMSPITIEGMKDFFSNKTLSIHKEAGSWKNEKERMAANRLLLLVRDIEHGYR